jgi:hypothetical protein
MPGGWPTVAHVRPRTRRPCGWRRSAARRTRPNGGHAGAKQCQPWGRTKSWDLAFGGGRRVAWSSKHSSKTDFSRCAGPVRGPVRTALS